MIVDFTKKEMEVVIRALRYQNQSDALYLIIEGGKEQMLLNSNVLSKCEIAYIKETGKEYGKQFRSNKTM